jgi:hypothetical protein
MTERVTVEYNGEMVTVDVPDGTTDEQIKAHLAGQEKPKGKELTATTPSISSAVEQQSGLAAIKPAMNIAGSQMGDLVKLGKIAGEVTPSIMGEFLSTPIKSARDLAGAYVSGHPTVGSLTNMPFKQMPGAVMRGIGAAALGPESAFSMPYSMAAYEQEKIRANPNAPEYANNPYAMQQRGQAATQGAAGAMNQRQAVAGQQYGGLSADDQARLEEDRIQQMARYTAAKKALGNPQPGTPQQPPVGGPAAEQGSTFIQRMSQKFGTYTPIRKNLYQ